MRTFSGSMRLNGVLGVVGCEPVFCFLASCSLSSASSASRFRFLELSSLTGVFSDLAGVLGFSSSLSDELEEEEDSTFFFLADSVFFSGVFFSGVLVSVFLAGLASDSLSESEELEDEAKVFLVGVLLSAFFSGVLVSAFLGSTFFSGVLASAFFLGFSSDEESEELLESCSELATYYTNCAFAVFTFLDFPFVSGFLLFTHDPLASIRSTQLFEINKRLTRH